MVRLLHVALAGALLFGGADACTNLLVSPGASADKSTIYAYNADSGSLYGSIGLYPATFHPPNATREIWDFFAAIEIDPPSDPADLDGDGFVGVSDVLAGLSEFGCDTGCTVDLDGDGATSVSDILTLLSAFGEMCPN